MSTGNVISLLLIGLMAGYLSGLLGIGGGVVIVPALVYFLGFSQPVAQGTSLALFTLPVGLIAASRYYKKRFVDLKAAGIMLILFLAGSYLGSLTATRISETWLKRIFAVLLIGIAFKMIYDTRK